MWVRACRNVFPSSVSSFLNLMRNDDSRTRGAFISQRVRPTASCAEHCTAPCSHIPAGIHIATAAETGCSDQTRHCRGKATLIVTGCAATMTTTDGSSLDNLSRNNNNNGSMSGAVDDVEALMNDVIGIWITGCICLLGIAGNIISFVVLKRAFGVQSPMFHVLRAMSVSDSVFLLAVFTVQSAVNAYQYLGLHHLAENYRGYVQYGVWPLLMTTQVTENTVIQQLCPAMQRRSWVTVRAVASFYIKFLLNF